MENLKKDVEMKDDEVKKAVTDPKKVVEEVPTDPFYGKYLITHNLVYRTEEADGSFGEGRQGEGFQDGCHINQII